MRPAFTVNPSAALSFKSCTYIALLLKMRKLSFSGGSVIKNPPANSGDTDSIPAPGRSHITRQLSRCAATTEAHEPRVRALQQEANAMRSLHTST